MLIALALAAAAAPGAQTERHPLAGIREAVVQFVTAFHGAGADLAVAPGDLDSRLRLAPCPQPLAAAWASGSAHVGRVTVEVRCTAGRPWRLYVPSQVTLKRDVVVAARPLARGQRLSPADLRRERRDLGRVGGDAVLDPARVLGYVLTRPLAAGSVLEPRLLEAPRLVERGQRVQLVAEGPGIHISMAGQALDDGALGDTVRVRNPASRQVVDAVVSAPGRVSLRVGVPSQVSMKQ